MYKTKIFDKYCVEDKLAEFLNENKISRDQIISISMSSDSEAHDRLCERSVDRILLVWDDGITYKTIKEINEERKALYKEWEENSRRAEEKSEEFKKILSELQASLEKS
jgi:shikimate kinase